MLKFFPNHRRYTNSKDALKLFSLEIKIWYCNITLNLILGIVATKLVLTVALLLSLSIFIRFFSFIRKKEIQISWGNSIYNDASKM